MSFVSAEAHAGKRDASGNRNIEEHVPRDVPLVIAAVVVVVGVALSAVWVVNQRTRVQATCHFMFGLINLIELI